MTTKLLYPKVGKDVIINHMCENSTRLFGEHRKWKLKSVCTGHRAVNEIKLSGNF